MCFHTSVDHTGADWWNCNSCRGGADRSRLRTHLLRCVGHGESTPPAEGRRNPRAVCGLATLVVVQDRAGATVLGEQRVAAVAEQVEVEVLVRLLLAVAIDLDRDGLRRLAWREGQRAGPGDVVVVA